MGFSPDLRDEVPPPPRLADTVEDLVSRPWFMFGVGIVALVVAFVGLGNWSLHVYPVQRNTDEYWYKPEVMAARDARHVADKADASVGLPTAMAMTFGGGVAGVLLVGRACFRVAEGV